MYADFLHPICTKARMEREGERFEIMCGMNQNLLSGKQIRGIGRVIFGWKWNESYENVARIASVEMKSNLLLDGINNFERCGQYCRKQSLKAS